MHSGDYHRRRDWKGRKALVLGTGNSGHDVAQDLAASGADVTIIQRSPTYVVSLNEAQSVYAIYTEGIPFEDCDLLATSLPYPVLQRSYQLSTAEMPRGRQGLLDGPGEARLPAALGEDDTGFQMMYLRRGGGYYFNVGCSDMIIAGRVRLLQFADIERFVAAGRAAEGRHASCRPNCWCWRPATRTSRKRAAYLGDAIADRIGPVWGFDEGGELRNMWRRDGAAGPVVHRRQPGAMPHLFALSGAADQGVGARRLCPEPPAPATAARSSRCRSHSPAA